MGVRKLDLSPCLIMLILAVKFNGWDGVADILPFKIDSSYDPISEAEGCECLQVRSRTDCDEDTFWRLI